MANSNKTFDPSGVGSLLAQLPTEKWWADQDLYQWEGSWYLPSYLEGTLACRSHFEASVDDVYLASIPKVGTTWMKAFLACILGCHKKGDGETYVVDDDNDCLIKNHPHILVKTLESQLYMNCPSPNLAALPSPRLFHTHLPYHTLPESIRNISCKMVYVTRNPKDTFISLWHFLNTTRSSEQGPFPIEKAFEGFCSGITPYGPFFDHVLEYWKESQKSPEKILFIKYEDMKKDPKEQLRRLSSFLGKPLANDEEVEKVLWRCSFERLKNLEVNKNGMSPWVGITNSSFFRLGVVGDWKNNFGSEMRERLDKITHLKLEGSGLDFEI